MNLQEFTNRIMAVKDKLFRFAARITGQPAEAEDVVQEVFLRVWDKRDDRHNISNLEGFCMQIARNLSIDRLRLKDNQHQSLDALPPDNASDWASPQKLAEQNDMMQYVRQCIEQLPEKQKMVLQLREVEEMSYQEIADILEIPIDQVKVNLFRARNQLREQLSNIEQYGLR